MSRIFTRCCVCNAVTNHKSKYCDEHRRAAHLEQKSSWERRHRPPTAPYFVVYSAVMTIVNEPDVQAGFPTGAQLLGSEVRRLLEKGYMTPGAVLVCKGRRLVVAGAPFKSQTLELEAVEG